MNLESVALHCEHPASYGLVAQHDHNKHPGYHNREYNCDSRRYRHHHHCPQTIDRFEPSFGKKDDRDKKSLIDHIRGFAVPAMFAVAIPVAAHNFRPAPDQTTIISKVTQNVDIKCEGDD